MVCYILNFVWNISSFSPRVFRSPPSVFFLHKCSCSHISYVSFPKSVRLFLHLRSSITFVFLLFFCISLSSCFIGSIFLLYSTVSLFLFLSSFFPLLFLFFVFDYIACFLPRFHSVYFIFYSSVYFPSLFCPFPTAMPLSIFSPLFYCVFFLFFIVYSTLLYTFSFFIILLNFPFSIMLRLFFIRCQNAPAVAFLFCCVYFLFLFV